ncbi:MAG: hypothetical protein ACI376_04015 [Candidatus Bruticola sp.]
MKLQRNLRGYAMYVMEEYNMNYRYGILATALAVGLFAIPATAGVTDVTGGSGVKVNTTVKSHYTDVNTYKTNEKQLSNIYKSNTVDNSSVKYKVEGTLNYEDHGGSHGGTYNFGSTASNFTDAYNDVANSMRGYDKAYQQGRVGTRYSWQMSQSEFNTAYNLNGSWYMGNYYSQDGKSTVKDTKSVKDNTKTTTSTSTKQTTNTYTDYKEVSTSTKLDNSTLTYNGINYSSNSIFVGDPDSIFNAYSASGSATINQTRDDYYTRTHKYERDHITQNTVTTTTTISGTKTYVYQMNATRVWSPIILDLDGDGKIEASNGQYLAHDGFSDKVVAFDFFGNGFPMLMEWVGPNDGLLCRPNADGSVKGTNLFGSANGCNNGYEEMASLDTDNSGALEGAELKGLKVWTDLNGNGIAEAGELKSLDELGITAIKVSHNNYSSTFVRNGQTFKSFDWWPNCREMRKVDMAGVIK